MPKIIPIRDLKNTTKISEMCNSLDEPVFITKNGYEDMVIMGSSVYEKIVHPPVKYDFTPPSEPVVAEAAGDFYSVKKYSLNEIRKVLSPILDKYNVKKAILFGSYAKGKANEKSDIDLLVDSGLKGLSFFGLVNDIEESFRIPVDVFDLREIIKDSEIDFEIKQSGVLIYGE